LIVALALACVSLAAPSSAAERPHGGFDGAAVHLVNGAFLGIAICEAGDNCWGDAETSSVAGGAALGGLAGYFVGSMLPRGQMMTINTGMVAGLLVGGVIGDAAYEEFRESTDDWVDRDRFVLNYFIGGELVGGALGAALGWWQDPDPARVSLANSAGMWGLALASMAESLRDRAAIEGSRLGGWSMAALFSLAFTGGWLAWDDLPLQRWSVWKIDLGGVLGFVGGMVYAGRAMDNNNGSDGSSQATRALLTGTAIGLGVGTWLALRDDSASGVPVTASAGIAPLPGGGGMLTLRGAF